MVSLSIFKDGTVQMFFKGPGGAAIDCSNDHYYRQLLLFCFHGMFVYTYEKRYIIGWHLHKRAACPFAGAFFCQRIRYRTVRIQNAGRNVYNSIYLILGSEDFLIKSDYCQTACVVPVQKTDVAALSTVLIRYGFQIHVAINVSLFIHRHW